MLLPMEAQRVTPPIMEHHQNSLPLQDFLLDMDFDEFIPVDNFFDSYVSQVVNGPQPVSQKGLQRTSANSNQGTASSIIPASTTAANNSISWQQQAPAPPLTPIPDLFSETSQSQPWSLLGQNQAPPQNLSQHHIPPPPAQSIRSSAPANGPVLFRNDMNPAVSQAAMEQPNAGALTDHSSERDQPRNGAKSMDATDVATSGGVSKLSKGERQQMLNKAAQQRYRERKKAKALKLEQAVQVLQEKVEELDVVEGEKRALKEKVLALERELYEKNARLLQLQDEVSLAQTQSKQSTPGDMGSESQDTNEELSQLVQDFHGRVADVRTYLVTNHLLECNPPKRLDELAPDQIDVVRSKTEACLMTCVRIHRLVTDVDTFSMVEASIDSVRGRIDGDEESWYNLVHRLTLSPEAIERARALREQYLRKLEIIYMDRQQLNLTAVKALLPEDVGGAQPSGRSSWFSFKGFFKRHKHTNRVAVILAKMKANLVEEQRALGELDVVVLTRLLDPLQAAQAVVTSYPNHCDVVSLLNAIHHVHSEPSRI